MIADGERLKALVNSARRRVLLCAPFINVGVLRTVLSVIGEEVAVRIVTLDRPERGRRSEERGDLVLGPPAPEGPGVRRADWLALENDGRLSSQQRALADVGVSNGPAGLRSRSRRRALPSQSRRRRRPRNRSRGRTPPRCLGCRCCGPRSRCWWCGCYSGCGAGRASAC